MRLAKEEDSERLTGFTHGAVTPVGLATDIPIIISDKITQLEPAELWVGGGEVDLKMGCSVADFLKASQAYVLDCTY